MATIGAAIATTGIMVAGVVIMITITKIVLRKCTETFQTPEFKSNIKNPDCKHKWHKMTSKAGKYQLDYLLCEKCNSTMIGE